MDHLDIEDMSLYAEEDDASVIIPFQFAGNLPNDFLSQYQSEQRGHVATPSSSSAPSSTNHLPDVATRETKIEDASIFDMLRRKGHTMWKEACLSLRHLGTFSTLPLDVQVVIMSMLNVGSLSSLSRVNMDGFLVGRQDTFWSELYETDFGTTDRVVNDEVTSWMVNYKEMYGYTKKAILTYSQAGHASTTWSYMRGTMMEHGVFNRRWTWNPNGKYILLPSMQMAYWTEERQTLIHGTRRYMYQPSTERFMSSNSAIFASSTVLGKAPPKRRIYINSRVVTTPKIILIQGTIPIPMLMAIIFGIE